MAFFRRDTDPKKQDPQYSEIFEFPFEVLWLDEEPSSLLQYLPAVVQIILLVWILVKVSGLK